MLDFYKPNLDYIEYLQKEETTARGFTRVPNMLDQSYNKEKFVCGIVLNIHDVDYYVPVTSYKIKKIKQYTNYKCIWESSFIIKI